MTSIFFDRSNSKRIEFLMYICQPELVGTSIIDVMPINESTIGTIYDG